MKKYKPEESTKSHLLIRIIGLSITVVYSFIIREPYALIADVLLVQMLSKAKNIAFL